MREKCIPLLLIMFSLLLFTGACRKDDLTASAGQLMPGAAYRQPVSAAERELVGTLLHLTELLAELYKDTLIQKEVNAAIDAGVYADESVLLKDLLIPGNSLLSGSVHFKELEKKEGFRFGNFSERFSNVVSKAKDSRLTEFLRTLEGNSSDWSQQVSIYFPYHDLAPRSAGFTLVPAQADADEGFGYQPYYDRSGQCRYKQVVVNDEYAVNHPTHIIGINGVSPQAAASLKHSSDVSGRTAASGLIREVRQVFVNDVRCRKQYDALISFTGNGGGSEIRFTRGDGFLKEQDGQVQPADIFIMGEHTSISRKDIRKANWVSYELMWDEDWEMTNTEQFMAIFEEDNRNEWNLDFGVKTTVKKIEDVNVDGNIDGSLRFKSDDFVIRQTTYNYDVFFAMNRMNPEGEMYKGWPVRDKNALVSFTFADQIWE